MKTFLILLGLFTLSTINSVEGLKCVKGTYSGDFISVECEDQCADVVFEQPGCKLPNDNNWPTLWKGCARAGQTCHNLSMAFPSECKVANCSLCQTDLCNRKFADGPLCQEGQKYNSSTESFREIFCFPGEQCFKAVYAEPCSPPGWSQFITMETGCAWENFKSDCTNWGIRGCLPANCSVCQGDLCNAEPSPSSSPASSSTGPESSSPSGVAPSGIAITNFLFRLLLLGILTALLL